MQLTQAEAGRAGPPGRLPIDRDLGARIFKACKLFEVDDADSSPNMTRDAERLPDEFSAGTTTSVEPVEEDGVVNQKQALCEGQDNLVSYKLRIEDLQHEAELDGYALNGKSETDFWKFVRSAPDFRRGSLVLIDNGNLRAIWENEQDSHLGLQFLGDDMVQYVIFRRRETARKLSRVAGRDTIGGVSRQIEAFDLGSLLRE